VLMRLQRFVGGFLSVLSCLCSPYSDVDFSSSSCLVGVETCARDCRPPGHAERVL
jgi:hypothetical protein